MDYTVRTVDEHSIARKLFKIFPYSTGGFGISVPYHSSKKGYLLSTPVDYSIGTKLVPLSEVVEYSVSDSVKLSMHPSGFVHFSSAQGNTVVSGRNDDGSPKGFGLYSSPLSRPISS